MNVLELASAYATYRRHSTAKGGEYVGPCPAAGSCSCGGGGDDRFHIWPEQGENGTFWCRKGDIAGDAIQFLIDVEGKSYPEACRILGKEVADQHDYRTPQPKKKPAENWQPKAPALPADPWREHAAKFVDWAHQQLLSLGDGLGTPLHYLAQRGIRQETAVEFRLGWNPGEKGKDLYRAREAWGLETVIKGDKKKKLWLPIGLVIPFYVADILRRVRIRIPEERRTPEFNTPYYIVPGSAMDTFVTTDTARAWFVTEAELDAILIHQEAGDLTGCMAMGNSSAKPTAEAHDLLSEALHIANALDYDLREGSADNPGGVSWLWWKRHFAQADRWPVPLGKDPGDAWKKGVDIREWVKLGLPPVLTLPAPNPEPRALQAPEGQSPEPALFQDHPGMTVETPPREEAPPAGQPVPDHLAWRTKTGRLIYIAETAAVRDRLCQPGQAWFTHAEMLALKGLPAEEIDGVITAKERIIDIKELFGGEVEGVYPDDTPAGKPGQTTSNCCWSKQ